MSIQYGAVLLISTVKMQCKQTFVMGLGTLKTLRFRWEYLVENSDAIACIQGLAKDYASPFTNGIRYP